MKAGKAFSKGKWHKGVAEWVEGDTAFLSVVFTWDLPAARAAALWYADHGFRVRAGGPALFTPKCRALLEDVAEIGGQIPDALRRHNPMATKASEGCPVGCWFCIVPAMEGKTFTLLPDFEPRPVLTDNNLSALPADYQQHIVDRYWAAGVPLLDANSGFEPKTFDEEVFRRWQPINGGVWRFAFDESGEREDVRRVIAMLRRNGVNSRKIQVYVLIGNEPVEACMARIHEVIEWGGEPYVQPVMKLNALTKEPWVRFDWTAHHLKQVQRWVNAPPKIWKKVPFVEYNASAKGQALPTGNDLPSLAAVAARNVMARVRAIRASGHQPKVGINPEGKIEIVAGDLA
jgi:hypothetical protein